MKRLAHIIVSSALLFTVAACSEPSADSLVFRNYDYDYAPSATYATADQGVFHMSYSR